MKRGKLIKQVIYIILFIILIYNLIIIFKSFVYPNKTPSFLGVKTYIVASGSMEPELNIGDIVIVKEVLEEELLEKDIISYREGQKIITHRISSIILVNGEIKYRTKGDNNNDYDRKLISYNDIEGKLIFKIPKIGKILIGLQNNNMIILIIMSFYVFMLWQLFGNKRD